MPPIRPRVKDGNYSLEDCITILDGGASYLAPFIDYRCTLWYISSMSKGVLNIRGVPTDLIRRAKSAAALQGVTLREWVLKAIQEKLKRAK